MADVLVNCVPVSCMPSPESPAKRMVTVSTSSRFLSGAAGGFSMMALITLAQSFVSRMGMVWDFWK
jgi:hypothetical protein